MRSKFLQRFFNQFDGCFLILAFLFSGRKLLEETRVNRKSPKDSVDLSGGRSDCGETASRQIVDQDKPFYSSCFYFLQFLSNLKNVAF